MDEIEIVSLTDRPDLIDVCAAWDYAEWGCHMDGVSLDTAKDNFERCSTDHGLPQVWLALLDQKPVGMITLTNDDHPDRTDLFPWLSALYVHPKYRANGIGTRLCEKLINECGNAAISKLYLYTATAQRLYERLGWKPIGLVAGPTGTDETLMVVNISNTQQKQYESRNV